MQSCLHNYQQVRVTYTSSNQYTASVLHLSAAQAPPPIPAPEWEILPKLAKNKEISENQNVIFLNPRLVNTLEV